MSRQAATAPHASGSDPLAALRRAGGSQSASRLRRALPAVAMLGAIGAVAVVAPRVAHVFGAALLRAVHADPRWVVAGVAFELASFAGYIVLFWHVAGRTTPRMGLRASYEVSLAGTAATRLLPTAGAGGAALTFWALRRAGHSSGTAARTLLTFLVVLYSVFLASLAVAGTLLATGAAGGHVSSRLSAVPAVAAAAAIAVALLLGARHRRANGSERPARTSGRLARLHGAAGALGGAVHEARSVVGRPHPRLLGAFAWWGFDMLVIWALFNAFGTPPAPAVLVLGYFLGQVANTVPLPGAASGGMVAAFLALGLPAEMVLPAILGYRAIAIWTPVPAGAAAIAGLRRTVRRWAEEDDAEELPACGRSRSRHVRRGAAPARRRTIRAGHRVAAAGTSGRAPPARGSPQERREPGALAAFSSRSAAASTLLRRRFIVSKSCTTAISSRVAPSIRPITSAAFIER
jgi:uncharacterized membrane protein YbhN (UPF0104 family)